MDRDGFLDAEEFIIVSLLNTMVPCCLAYSLPGNGFGISVS